MYLNYLGTERASKKMSDICKNIIRKNEHIKFRCDTAGGSSNHSKLSDAVELEV